MIKFIGIFTLIFSLNSKAIDVVPLRLSQLPTDQFSDDLKKIANQVNEFSDDEDDKKSYEGIKKFLTNYKVKTEKFLSKEPVWVFQMKKHPSWYIVFFKVDQIKSEGTFHTLVVALLKQSGSRFNSHLRKDLKSFYDLQKSKPRNFVEYIAKTMGDQTTERVLSAELKKTKDGFDYLFTEYTGDGHHIRKGKLSQNGKLLEREIQYGYCSHSMGSENRCFEKKLKQIYDLKTDKANKIEGLYLEYYRDTKKMVHKIEIKDSQTLKTASAIGDNATFFRRYFKEPIPKELLEPVQFCNEGKCN